MCAKIGTDFVISLKQSLELVAKRVLSGVQDRFFLGCDRAGARDYAAFLGFFSLEPS